MTERVNQSSTGSLQMRNESFERGSDGQCDSVKTDRHKQCGRTWHCPQRECPDGSAASIHLGENKRVPVVP